ncbi:MAG: hypothetical protein R2719_15835 [Micropruina sp.]
MAYKLTPHRILGTHRAAGIEFRRTGTEQEVRLDAGLVLTSIGYRGARSPARRSTRPPAWCPTTAGG